MSTIQTRPDRNNGQARQAAKRRPSPGSNGKQHAISDTVIRAYREAAGALAAYLTDRRFRPLSIVEGEGSEGLTAQRWEAFAPGKCSDPAMRDRVERLIIELFAGDVAQEILTGKPLGPGKSSDFHQIAELGTCVMETGEVLEAYLRYMALRTKHILLLPHNWDAVQVLADELLKRKRLDTTAARRILNDAMSIGLKDLMHHCSGKTAVAPGPPGPRFMPGRAPR